MFFIGIFGISDRKKNLGDIEFKCTGCLSKKAKFIEVAMSFQFFFIPVFSWNKRHLVICEVCGSTYQLKESSVKKVVSEKMAEYADVMTVVYENKVCPECGNPLYHTDYKYCPRCGKKL